jgi:mono/diheme cytochrome c family protein
MKSLLSRVPTLIAACSLVWAGSTAAFASGADPFASGADPEPADGSSATEQPRIEFARDVLPILSANCYACHGPDEGHRQAGLRLDVESGATASAGLEDVVVAGEPGASPLITRISSTDPGEVMPPPDFNRQLKPEQIEILRRWVAQGADWQQHWAFRPVTRPAGSLDDLVRQRLATAGLNMRPTASPHALARRLSLDLIGLPPTPEMADALATDPSPEAVERYVDDLLSRPEFGEHWARMWLDLARYADTKGYEKDRGRTMWPYRDWVINAFNSDMPLDQFTREQLAGDLLPQPTGDQIIATAFHRNTMSNDEGGTDDEEFRVAAVKDRVNTTVQVWMGLTMGCAQCHTHKYDPISIEDYYRFYAIFNQTEDADRPDDAPRMELEIDDDQVQLPIMRELAEAKQRESRIHLRGNFLDQGEAVDPAVLAAFHPLPDAAAADRLGVAQWLTSPANPLTPRVWANRIWARIFGRGLVETEEDFGALGSPPTHPELLDLLAAEYRDGGWSLKNLLKTIVLSDTYQQSSQVDHELLQSDPANELLSRAPRYRLTGETLRDQALAVSGLLSSKLGGPPVMPPQPAGLWRSTYSGEQWIDAEGEDRFRRGVYTYLKRTTPYPAFLTFDGGSGEVCLVRRVRTNTPLQALVTLNDPVFLEAAAALARRMITEPDSPQDAARAAHGLRLALVRPLHDGEVEPLLRLRQDSLSRFEAEPELAIALIESSRGDTDGWNPGEMTAAEFASWIVVASTILNLDEHLTRN